MKLLTTTKTSSAYRLFARCFLIAAMLPLVHGCTNVERSRDVGNPSIAAEVTAKQVCSTCHGMTGNAASPNFPRLAGQPAAYLEEQLKNFRDKQRSDREGQQYMWGLTRKMNDQQIKDLAEYFAKQTPEPNIVENQSLLAQGRTIFEGGIPDKGVPACQSCHGHGGEGLATFPRLAGQHENYVIKQLKVFKETNGRPGTPMEQVAGKLAPNEISAVAAYVQALPNNNKIAGSSISIQ